MVPSAPQLAKRHPSGLTGPDAVWRSPIGPVAIRVAGDRLVGIDFLPDDPPEIAPRGGYAAEVLAQLQGYFQQPQRPFDLTLATTGTPFQERVWAELRRIPPGRMRTYGELARMLGSSPRAVGGACRANPCPLVTPCHRVISAQGLGGFMGRSEGRALEIKHWLLHHEGVAA